MLPCVRVRIRLVVAAFALVVPFLPASQTALAAPSTRWVNDDGPLAAAPGSSCDRPGYRRIQDAVSAASAGERVNVCAGTYAEQVVVPAGKDNLALRSVDAWKAVI